jgi:hypothetical protein
MQIPRNQTLAEVLYRNLNNNEYLNEIYDSLLLNYSYTLFKMTEFKKDVNVGDALRFADILSKSPLPEKRDEHRLLGQEIAILLSVLYPEDRIVKYYLGSILSNIGNYRGLKSSSVGEFQSADILDNLYFAYDKSQLAIPGKENDYFFHDQKEIYDNLSQQYFSYSGPTSMGKSFVVQTFIKEQIERGEKKNYAIVVPTKALINEVRSNIIGSLQEKLKEKNYRVVTASGDLVLTQDHHFVFVMTPERLLYMLVGMPHIKIDFLFIDEAHKISERGRRSTYYYKVIYQIEKSSQKSTIIFASPNIPNPEIYFKLIPGFSAKKIHKLASKYTPVCQFRYYLDICKGKIDVYNAYKKKLQKLGPISTNTDLLKIVTLVGADKQNVIYCSSKIKVMDFAVKYASSLKKLDNANLIELAENVRKEVHTDCYLADLIERGVAYHVGYLPANIRLRIERSFENGDLRTIFCTNTLIEGVNLPADNLFITSYKKGNSNMNEVEFKNLVGRVGRIKYNLYGNVFLIRMDDKYKEKRYVDLLKNEVPEQILSIDNERNTKHFQNVIKDLACGDTELKSIQKDAKEKDYEALRNFSMILTRDIANNEDSPVKRAFSAYLSPMIIQQIREHFPAEKTSDDITLSYDQYDNLHQLILAGASYPKLHGENNDVDFDELVKFLNTLSVVFKWKTYERKTLGKSDSVIKWYAVILMQWIRGRGLSQIIYNAIRYKEKNPYTGVWIESQKIDSYYDRNSKAHKNYVIAEILSVIDDILLFRIANYFRRFSLEYKEVHHVKSFENDWYEYVEYGTTNPLTIYLQQYGFSREASEYIERSTNRKKYLLKEGDNVRIKKAILKCGNIGVETESQDIQFNVPELFVE